MSCPFDALAVYPGGHWLAETFRGRSLEIVERDGALHICYATEPDRPRRDWPHLFELYRDYMRDPVVLVIDNRGVEYSAFAGEARS